MADEMKMFFFGGNASDDYAFLQSQLSRGRTNPILSSFFEQVNLALRQEIYRLSPLDRELIPAFSTIEELVERASCVQAGNLAISSALLCISELADYIE